MSRGKDGIYCRYIKRLLDILLSGCALIVLSPVLLIVAILVRVKLGSLIYACDGVENYAISSPAADVEVEADQLPVLGTLTVEGMT